MTTKNTSPQVDAVIETDAVNNLRVQDLALLKSLRKKVAAKGRSSLSQSERVDARRLGLLR